MARSVTLFDDGRPFAVLVPGRMPCLISGLVYGPDGELVAGRESVAAALLLGFTGQLPELSAATPGELARIDQRLASLRDTYGAQSPPGTGADLDVLFPVTSARRPPLAAAGGRLRRIRALAARVCARRRPGRRR